MLPAYMQSALGEPFALAASVLMVVAAAVATKRAGAGAVLMTLQQASAEFGPPYSSLRDMVIRGHLAAVRLGDSRRIWVRRVDMEHLIEKSIERGV